MIHRIDSLKNDRIRRLAALHNPAAAREEGLFLLEGMRAVEELCDPWRAESVWVSDSYAAKNPDWEQRLCGAKESVWKEAFRCRTGDSVFAKIAGTQHPQGILAVVRRRPYTFGDLKSEASLWIVLERLQDPGNAGTILRTADACSASGILCIRGTVDFYNEKAIRAAMGSLLHIPFVTVETAPEAARFLREQGARQVGAHVKAETSCYDLSYEGPTAFWIGNEGAGLSEGAAALCTDLVKIPMPGHAESLNASVAASVLLYEALRQRRKA